MKQAMLQAANEQGRKRNGGDPLSFQASERALLAYFLARWKALDADVIVGHNIGCWDLNVLLQRLQHHKLPNWSSLGRIQRQRMPTLTGGGNMFGGGASLVRSRCLLFGVSIRSTDQGWIATVSGLRTTNVDLTKWPRNLRSRLFSLGNT
jgi:hypothetical protein